MLLIDKNVIEEIKINAGSDSFINTSELLSNSKEVEVVDIDLFTLNNLVHEIENNPDWRESLKCYQLIKIKE